MIGLAIVAFSVTAMTTVAVGLLRWSAVTVEARSGPPTRSVFAEPTSWQAWNARANIGVAAQRAIIASLPPPAAPIPDPSPQPSVAQAPDPNAAFALALSETPITPDETLADVTGSIGTNVFKLASTDVGPTPLSAIPSPRRDAQPLPLPRRRLAALTPTGRLGIEPDTRFTRTAIYDITAQTVYLPNGERLEAHSGLGPYMDNPLHVRLRMRGATPPNSYKLTLRERMFHGVRAIRLTPEDESAMYGRDGILAHTYMLGPNGQSNGCVSFKNYPRFLQAFLRGEVDRMVVVSRLDKLPTSFARRDVRGISTAF